jgi:very-short-patch-repair endonuclease
MEENKKTVAQRADDAYSRTVFSRSQLRDTGMGGRRIAASVARGHLVHVRRDRYALPSTHRDILEAVRIGGRLTCLSLLALFGVFVHRSRELHVLVTPGSSRLRVPKGSKVVLHWRVKASVDACLHAAQLADAAAHAVLCQAPREALATLDSIRHHGLMTEHELAAMFTTLPQRFRPLLALVDPSAGSGPETFMRLVLRAMGVTYETQVYLDGVGHVDFVVDGWLIIECDSKEFHEGWEKQMQDRARDIAAARQGYVTIRPLAKDILGDQAAVRHWLEQIIAVMGPRFAKAPRSQFSKNRR